MKKYLYLLTFLLIPFLIGAAPTRVNNFSTLTTIRSSEVNEDFNNLYGHFSKGVTSGSSYWFCAESDCQTVCQADINGGIVTSCSGSTATITGNMSADTIWDAKGDLAVGTASNTASRLAVGANNTVLTADSTAATGVKWAASTGGLASTDIDTYSELNTIVADVTLTHNGLIDTYSELNAIVADVTLTHNGLIDTFAELDAIVADQTLVHSNSNIATATTASNLVADGVDALTEIAQGIKTAANDTSPLVVGTAGSNGEIAKWNTDGTLTDANVIIGTVTDGKWCSYASAGTLLSCTQDTPAGSGDITDVFSCASGDCSSITMAATDLLNMSGTDASTATEGLILPQHATACAGGTAEGQVCWESDANILHMGDGATIVDFVPTSAFSGEATVSTTGAVTLADSVTTNSWTMGTFSATQLTSPTLLTDLIDGVGAVDMDYGSADVTDHTFTSDGGTVIIDGNINSSTLTASEIVITDGSKNLVSAAVATYPSLTELSYVKGGTSSFQTQLGTKPNSICKTIETPADADNLIVHYFTAASTISSIYCIVEAATSAVITVQECDVAGDNCSGIDGATTITCDVGGQADDGALSNAGVDATDTLRIDVGTVTGTVGQVMVCVNF